ncbi:Uncharacterised protein [Mycobacterium tuberculosis]|nr:Uncharacterised protein [Mycobacterium tuberculosis]
MMSLSIVRSGRLGMKSAAVPSRVIMTGQGRLSRSPTLTMNTVAIRMMTITER